MRIFSFAIGNIWRWGANINRAELVSYAQKLDVSGVEITFAKKEELYNFKLNKKQIKRFRELDYVSIHAPFRLVRRADNEKEVLKQLDYIEYFYKKINAQNVIIHPNELPKPGILRRYKMKFSTENLPKKRHVDIKKMSAILKKYKNLGLCLDVAHAYYWSKYETGRLVRKFRDRITQVHLSGNYKKEDHVSLRKVSPEFMKSIEPIKKLNVPIVIEEDIKVKNVKWVEKEIGYIKSLFE